MGRSGSRIMVYDSVKNWAGTRNLLGKLKALKGSVQYDCVVPCISLWDLEHFKSCRLEKLPRQVESCFDCILAHNYIVRTREVATQLGQTMHQQFRKVHRQLQGSYPIGAHVKTGVAIFLSNWTCAPLQGVATCMIMQF